MTAAITVHAPCKLLNSNQRLHPLAKARLTALWRAAATAAAIEQDARPFVLFPVRVVVHVHAATARRYDAGNVYPTAKAVVDGLTDAGLWPDDENDFVVGPDLRRGPVRKGKPALTVTFQEGWAGE